MSDGIGIDFGGFDKFLERAIGGEGIRNGIRRGAEHYRTEMRRYPPKNPRKQPFTSLKQQRGFFAKLKAGEIVVPYPRTHALRDSINIVYGADGMTARVGSSSKIAGLVIGSKQTLYHKGTPWQTFEQVGARERPRVMTIIINEIKRDMRSAGA